ncbi:hypothetical protein ACWD0A_12595 [Streptomyces sp. NPDC002867]
MADARPALGGGIWADITPSADGGNRLHQVEAGSRSRIQAHPTGSGERRVRRMLG